MNEALDVEAWIELAKSNPVEYRRRQAAHVLLESIARIPELRSILYLKGGALMNLAYGSPRRTTDIDFTTTDPPKGFQHYIKAELDTAMRTAATSAVRRAASGEGSMNTFNIVLRWPEIQRVLVKEA